MKFLTQHTTLFLMAITLGTALSVYLGRINTLDVIDNGINRSKLAKIILGALAAAFIVWGLLVPSLYYFPNNIGVLGDNYIHMTSALQFQSYLKDHHLAYPLTAEKLIGLMLKLGLLSTKDPMYLEKAYVVASWPIKFAMTTGLILIFAWFARFFRSFFIGWLAFFGAAFTYGCWIWSLHSNGIGLAIAAEIFTVFLLLEWREKNGMARLIIFAAMNALCVFVYNGLLFFTVGTTAAFVIADFFLSQKSLATRFKNAFLFLIVSAIAGFFFYKLQSDLHGTRDLHRLYQQLGDTSYGGAIGDSMRGSLLSTFKDNVVTSIMHFTNIWEPSNRFESILILSQLASIIGLIIALILQRQRVWTLVRRTPAFLFAAISVIMFLCFMLNRAATHYSVITLIPNLFLLFFLIFASTGNDRERGRAESLMLLFITSSFLYSGFSSQSVYRGNDIKGEFYYRDSMAIEKVLNPNDQATYIRDFEYTYIYAGLESYYRGKFPQIHWQHPGAPASLRQEIETLRTKSGQRVFINKPLLDNLNAHSPVNARAIGDDIYEIN